tara:strand:- start:446 stop:1939 length:1494 start_codon:yes stop_codon:yes gene_type:complete
MSKLSDARKARSKGIADSLSALKYQVSGQAAADSLALLQSQQEEFIDRVNSLEGANRAADKLSSFMQADSLLNKGPVLGGLSDEQESNAYDGIKNILRDIVEYEASTNVEDDYDKFVSQIRYLEELHGKYQNLNPSGLNPFGKIDGQKFNFQGMGTEVGTNILNESNLRFQDEDGLDTIIGRVLNEDNESSADGDLKRVTIARIAAGDEEIHNMIYGKLNPSNVFGNRSVSQEGGFNQIVKEFNLDGSKLPDNSLIPFIDRAIQTAGDIGKEIFDIPTGESNLLFEALSAKRKGVDYFTNSIDLERESSLMFQEELKEYYNDLGSGLRGMPDVPVQSQSLSIMNTELAKLDPSIRTSVIEKLQSYVDDIYLRITSIEDNIDVAFDFKEFNRLKSKFYKPVDMSLDNFGSGVLFNNPIINKVDPMLDPVYQKLQSKKDNLYKSLTGYEQLTGDKLEVLDILNDLSIESLGKEIETLPEEEQTENFNQLLIDFSNQLQQ